MQLISRAAWGAPATSPAAALPSARGVAVHYLGVRYDSRPHSQCAAMVRSVRDAHLANKVEGYLDVAYNYLACEHGYVYEGRGAGRRSGANGGTSQNANYYAVCALHGTSGQPSDALLRGLAEAIAHLQQCGAGREVVCHGDLTATDCPGGPLTSWVRGGHPLPPISTQPNTPTPEEDAVPTAAAFRARDYTRKLRPDEWTLLNWTRRQDGEKWATKDPEPSLLLAPCQYTASFGVRIKGLQPGDEVQLRFSYWAKKKDGDGWERVATTPIDSPAHVGGGGHFTYQWTGRLPKGHRLRAEVLHFRREADAEVVCDRADFEANYWPA
ncbi:peptidoglycan recognition protein family protein [Streptomyces sp. XM4011]|uniref:peptidoglycan recognition protein family protein n=1 Tax=Streptomyces sp. XM4011 TaxID=2929780 RepID=UPI001FFAED06|nr:peptidoglycan recognition family protein [Streptomyces sp. XM4011]MCK1813247.1 peptidoglycan recognition protein family protein [Streptomyces sp. XM4011]